MEKGAEGVRKRGQEGVKWGGGGSRRGQQGVKWGGRGKRERTGSGERLRGKNRLFPTCVTFMILRRRVTFMITCECLLFPFIILRRVGAKHNSKNCLSI